MKNEDVWTNCTRTLHIYFFFQGLTKEFQLKDDNQAGKTEITYEDFLEMVFSCGPLFSYS